MFELTQKAGLGSLEGVLACGNIMILDMNEQKISAAIELLEDVVKTLERGKAKQRYEPQLTILDLQIGFPHMRDAEVRFALALLNRNGSVATDEELCRETGISSCSLKVYACHCRSRFSDAGIKPSIIRSRETGYRMSADAIAAIFDVARG